MSDVRWAGMAVALACASVLIVAGLIRLYPVLRRGDRSTRTPDDVEREDPNCCQVCGHAVPLLAAADIDEPPWPGGVGWFVNLSKTGDHQFATRVCRDCWNASQAIEAEMRRDAEEEVDAKAREAAAWLAGAPVVDVPSHDLRADHGWKLYGAEDAARHLGRFSVYGKGAMGYAAEEDELPASYRDGVTRPGYDDVQGCYLSYAGSVFRTTDGHIAVKWRERHREYPD
ncbi:hypothetical protein [Streptomyces sp. NPDC057877]|uniref:hypothetical protein n=1 Tax=Streptomyces sp. NPDC057877 TaxID=3346269 RepID=UPI00368959E3